MHQIWQLVWRFLNSLIGGALYLGVICPQGKFEVADRNETTEGEPAAGMTDETCRRGYDRARLTVSTTR